MSLAEAVSLLEQGDWRGAHSIVQHDESALGCWAHGIMHLMEGDESNARYWYRRAGREFSARSDLQDELGELKRHLERSAGG
jgi:hypothetical protein